MASNSEIFSRERLAGYEPECLANGVALIVGAGALGQNTAQNLALAGIGEMRIVDKDQFEPHNRTRSPAYPFPEEAARFGLQKARAVAGKLRRLMTSTNPVMRYADNWIQELGDGAFKNVSLVLSCVDTPSARAYLSDKARFHGVPFIEGGFDGPDITLSSYPAANGEAAVTTPCWRCSHQETAGAFSCDFYAEQVERAGFIPAIQNAAATLAGLQCEAAMVALHSQMVPQFEARAFDLNIRTGRSLIVKLSTDPACAGIHRSLDKPPVNLRTTADQTVANLLDEIATYFNEAPTIILRPLLIWSAPCITCERMTMVRQPSWAWEMQPRCSDCGGRHPLQTHDVTDSPIVYTQIMADSAPELMGLSCQQIGLPPLSLVEATVPRSESTIFELAGSIDHLFNLGDAHE